MASGRDYRYGEIARVQGVNVPIRAPGAPAAPAAAPMVRESLITLEASFASLHPDVRPRGPETGAFILNRDETLKLRIFIDKSVVEVFANGKQCVAARVYPSRDDSIGFSIRSQGQESELKSLEAWQMESIY